MRIFKSSIGLLNIGTELLILEIVKLHDLKYQFQILKFNLLNLQIGLLTLEINILFCEINKKYRIGPTQ